MFAYSVLSVMSVTGFPLIIMSAHAQCSICTCSIEGIPSLVCLHMLSVGASFISMQGKHCKQCGKDEGFFGKDKEKVKTPSSLPKILCLCHKILRLCHKITETDMTDNTQYTNTNWQWWPSLNAWIGLSWKILSATCVLLALWYHLGLLHRRWQV